MTLEFIALNLRVQGQYMTPKKVKLWYSKTPLFQNPVNFKSRFIQIYCSFKNGLK